MMSTDKQAVEDAPEAPAADGEVERQPSWWHRDHPTFAALSGFFTGLLFVALVPAIYVGILSLMFDNDRVEELFPFVLVTLVVPLGLVVSQRTRWAEEPWVKESGTTRPWDRCCKRSSPIASAALMAVSISPGSRD